ncbi:MAG TPA: hypothetical protein VKN35_00170, partial [Xanthomonadales bacterium]|nr:hypothetical protein [Xanthomonadales bacterium]
RHYFSEALHIDPNYAAAHAGMSDALAARAFWFMAHPHEVADRVLCAALEAERCDPQSPEAHMLLGAIAIYFQRDWKEAESRLNLAIELNPSLSHARLQYALFLAMQRRPMVQDEIDLAIRCDPLNPALMYLSALWNSFDGKDQKAESDIDMTLELAPGHPPATQLRADLAWRRQGGDALDRERACWSSVRNVLEALESADDPRVMRTAAEALTGNARSHYVAPLQIARLWALGGQYDRALQTLEAAVADDNLMQLDLLQLTPPFDPLRSDARFCSLVASLGMPP